MKHEFRRSLTFAMVKADAASCAVVVRPQLTSWMSLVVAIAVMQAHVSKKQLETKGIV